MSTQTSMSIKSFKNVAANLPPVTSILLRARHGVGKSKVVRQVAANIRKNLIGQVEEGAKVTVSGHVIDMAKFKNAKEFFPVIDRRLSQMTEGDMVGLPSTDGETTRFNPPNWYKQACDQPCVLFLDELNRATPEVMQAAFQIVLDRELNGFRLHPLTRVFSAVNTGASYTINEMDPALLDRFFTIDLNPDMEEWIEWARSTDPIHGGNLHDNVVDFIAASKRGVDGTSWLYGPAKEEPGSVSPSPRSWEMLHTALVHAGLMEKPTDEVFYHMSMGFLGVEAAIAFRDYCKNLDAHFTGEQIVNGYSSDIRRKVKKMAQGRQNDVIEKVASYVVTEITKLTDEQGTNLRNLMSDLPDELKLSLWSKLTVQGTDKIDLARSVHAHCVDLIMECFGVPMGEAGLGVMPNIPGIFKTQAKK